MIHLLDQLSIRPGHLAEVRRRVRRDYQPVVTALGVRLAQEWLAPPVELRDDPTDLLLLWELDDLDTYWTAKRSAARDPRVLAFWDGLGPMLAGRQRQIMAPADEVERTAPADGVGADREPSR